MKIRGLFIVIVLSVFLISLAFSSVAAQYPVTINNITIQVALQSDGKMDVEYSMTFTEHESRDKITEIGPFEEQHNIEDAYLMRGATRYDIDMRELRTGFYSPEFGITTETGEEYALYIDYFVDRSMVQEETLDSRTYEIFAWAPFQWSLPIQNQTVMLILPIELTSNITKPEHITQELIDSIGLGADLEKKEEFERWVYYPTIDEQTGKHWLSIYISKTNLGENYHFVFEVFIPEEYFTFEPITPPSGEVEPSIYVAIFAVTLILLLCIAFIATERKRSRKRKLREKWEAGYRAPEIEIETFEIPKKVPTLTPVEAALYISSSGKVITLIALGLAEEGIIKIASQEP
ncbi:MAG: hypothetical protein ACETWE_11170, partial [Candidatus Bathyarchaeia archaeon]